MIAIEGRLPGAFGHTRKELAAAARAFAQKSARRIRTPFCDVAVILQDDAGSDAVHQGIMGIKGATDVITQRYEPIAGEAPGVYGEIYVNVERALALGGWKELLLYVAHGFDHLSGADDLDEKGYRTMRRRELRWIAALG